jgi:hypothetical protein
MPRTISAAGHLSRSANARDFPRKVAACCSAGHRRVQFRRGAPAGVPVELLRDLVILTARLAGRRWLEANPDSVAVFTAVYLTRMPPPLASSARSLLAFCRAGSARRQRPQRPEQADLRVEVDNDA